MEEYIYLTARFLILETQDSALFRSIVAQTMGRIILAMKIN